MIPSENGQLRQFRALEPGDIIIIENVRMWEGGKEKTKNFEMQKILS